MVDAGDGKPVQIVCGAPNARAGPDRGALARPGAYVPGIDVTLTVGNIRGSGKATALSVLRTRARHVRRA